jgi:hypothetical protein
VNPLSAVVWSWRTLRGHSITFAVLFGSSLLGVSIVSLFRHWLSRTGAPWYLWLAVPAIIVGVLAKKEPTWVPQPEERRKWARRIFFGSIALAALLAFVRPAPPPDPDRKAPVTPTFHKVPR